MLEANILTEIDFQNGRNGMGLWTILVLGVLRVNLNWDYNQLEERAYNHKTIRNVFDRGSFGDDYERKLQILNDNVYLLTPEIVEKANQVIVETRLNLVKKRPENLTVDVTYLLLKRIPIIQLITICFFVHFGKLSV